MMVDLPHLAKLYEHGEPEPDPKRLQRGLEAIIGSFLPL